MSIILNHKFGNVYKHVPFKKSETYPSLYWDNKEAYWDESTFKCDIKPFKDERYKIVEINKLYIDKQYGYVIYLKDYNLYIWTNENNEKYDFACLFDKNISYLQNECIPISNVVDFTINVKNTENVIFGNKNKDKNYEKKNEYHNKYYDNKYYDNFSTRKKLDEYAIDTIEKLILKNKDKMTIPQLKTMLDYVYKVLYN